MRKRGYFIILVLLLSVSFAGCKLAAEEGNESAGRDRLIGVYVTTEHLDLFDMETYLEENLTNERTGEISGIKRFVFRDLEGFGCFAPLCTRRKQIPIISIWKEKKKSAMGMPI